MDSKPAIPVRQSSSPYDLLCSYVSKKQIDVTILDFSKAFKNTLHHHLFHKLFKYRTQGPLHT